MKARIPVIAAAVLSLSAVLASPIASAHDHYRDHDYYERGYDRGGPGWERGWDRGWRHEGYRRHERIVERTVVVRERPQVMYEPVYVQERPVVYRRDPSVVISVGLPPLVFPIR